MIESRRLPLEAWGRGLLTDAEAWADRSPVRGAAYEFLWFGLKQGWACLFGGLMLALIVGTFLLWPEGAPISRTFGRAWTYPGQQAGWEMVGLEKLGSWFLLMIISIVLVSIVHRPEVETAEA